MKPTASLFKVIAMSSLIAATAANGQSSENLGDFDGHSDVGAPKLPGSATYNATEQSYAVSGAGTNMWFTSDQCHFLWKKVNGDFILRTRLNFLGAGAVPHRKAGWMIRASLAPDAPYADCAEHGNGLTSLQFRRAAGTNTEEITLAITNADVLQFERRGNTYTFSAARYGEPFVSAELRDLNLGDDVYAGLFVCSHDGDVNESATFRDVRFIRPAAKDFIPYHDYIGSVLELLNVHDGKLQKIYSSAQPFEAPNWTRDGRALIYNISGRTGDWGRLCRFDLATGKPAPILTDPASQNNNDHVISFDGTMLGISDQSPSHGGQPRIFTVPIQGGTPRQITPLTPSYLHGWSPDGKMLVFTGGRSDKFDIYRIPSDGSGPEVRLTTSTGLNDGPEYTPDGRYIYFNSSRSGKMQIWRMHPDGSAQEQVTDDAYNNWFPHISPDGKWIVIISYPPGLGSRDPSVLSTLLSAPVPHHGRATQNHRLCVRRAGDHQRSLLVARQPAHSLRQQFRSLLTTMLTRMTHVRRLAFGFLLIFLGPQSLFALGGETYVADTPSRGSFPIVSGGGSNTADIYVDPADFPGVVRAVNDLQTDIARVTSNSLPIVHNPKAPENDLIIVGTLGHSQLIDQLVREKKIDPSAIAGKWESFFLQVVPNPLPNVKNALVIVGSDQRGTIYGLYDLSAQIGVSPWYFWADVPPQHHTNLYVKPGKFVQGPPAVKYRGIFLNDEAPDLTGWAKEKFGGYNHGFYTNVFELLLRLKANYLWPAMWDNCFSEDDPLNPQLASEYGIVMGTSHVEPMMRADKEWNRAGYSAAQWNFEKSPRELTDFWRAGIERNSPYENIITIAMRGKIDTAMSETANVALLENIVATQRDLIADAYHINAAAVPQLWALYKEVQEYYEKGMRVPDDVTLLWCDDNWGNLRKLPAAAEKLRSGGAGIYYHLDYVGGPRNYKWVNASPIPRIWEQMHLAHEYGADRIWIVNVGHLQHVALPTEFFLDYAWNPKRWPHERLGEFTQLWAAREFGPTNAPAISDIVARYTQFNGRRKPELLAPDTFSLVNYSEADRVAADWHTLAAQAQTISDNLPPAARDAFFELVLYPVKACANVNDLYILAAINHLYAAQGRASANGCADQVRTLFAADAGMSAYYNTNLANGKWSHMMDQTHIGYTGWQQPPSNSLPNLVTLTVPVAASMAIAIEGSTNSWPGCDTPPALPTFDKFNQPVRYIDIFNRGQKPFAYSASASAPWIQFIQSAAPDPSAIRLCVSLDWKRVPTGFATNSIEISDGGTNQITVQAVSFNPEHPNPNSIHGFVEADGYVSIDPEHYTHNVTTHSVYWDRVEGLGRDASGMNIFPVTAPSILPPHKSPCLEYQMYLFSSGPIEVESYLSPTLNFVAGRGLRFALSFDNQPPQIVTAVPADYSVGAGDGNRDWEETVKDNVRQVKTAFTLAAPGLHTLKFWMVDPGVVLQKLVVDTGGVKPSYLGPPESFHRP